MRFIALILIPAATLAGADLRWARYFGGPTAAHVRSISTMAVDNRGIIYVAGQHSASDSGAPDAFVAAIPPDGSNPLWSTSIGGPGDEVTVRLVADHSGNVYVTGRTDSSAFPGVASQDQPACPCSFVTKLASATGVAVFTKLWSGTVSDLTIGTDDASLYLAGSAGNDAEIRRLNQDGTWAWQKIIGGSNRDAATGIAIAPAGDIIITGDTESHDYPVTSGVYQGELGGTRNQFITRLSAGASEILWSTFFGNLRQTGGRIVLDSSGNIYVTGNARDSYVPWTHTNFPFGLRDLLAKFTPAGALRWVVPIGDSGLRSNIAVNAHGDVWLAGSNFSGVGGAVTPDAIQSKPYSIYPGTDALLVRISASGEKITYGTYLGGTGTDYASALAVDADENIYFAGLAWSPDFPVTGRVPADGRIDHFLAQIDLRAAPPVWIQSVVNAASSLGGPLVPGEVISIYGRGLGLADGGATAASNGRLPSSWTGTNVRINGVAAPLLYVSNAQINAIIPFPVTGIASVSVCSPAGCSNTVPLDTTPSDLAVFTQNPTGTGLAAALNQDNSLNSPSHPAHRGTVLQIWATGAGLTDPPTEDGAIADFTTGLRTEIEAHIGGVPADILYAGAAPGLPGGVVQVNVRVPEGTRLGETWLSIHTPSGYSGPLKQNVTVFVD